MPHLREAIIELSGGGGSRRTGRKEEADAIGKIVELDGHLGPPVLVPCRDDRISRLPGAGQKAVKRRAGFKQHQPVIEVLGGLTMVARCDINPTLLEFAYRIVEAAVCREPGDETRRD
jgi:hypothetical protein